ncbi:MAG: hypothetical protein J6Y02_06715 [Pseudobutyrivibrio sp.]|nr:hypothetical protein [Pseudobutyrivibrio sp.]
MNPKYFKDKIYVELNESQEYMKKSLDSIKSHPKWSPIFKTMSDERYAHSEQLYKMFLELYLESTDQENYLNSLRDAIVEMFASKTRSIECYRATYDILAENSEKEITDEERDTAV